MAEQRTLLDLLTTEPLDADVQLVALFLVEPTPHVVPPRGLVESIARFGVIEPVVLSDHPRDPAGYRIIGGRRRIAAARMADLKMVPARILRDPDALTEATIGITLNELRTDNPAADLSAIEQLMSAGHGEGEIARATGMPVSRVRRRLKLQRLVPQLRQAFAAGAIRANVAESASALPAPAQERLAAQLEESGRLSITDISQERLARRAAAVPIIPAAPTEQSGPIAAPMIVALIRQAVIASGDSTEAQFLDVARQIYRKQHPATLPRPVAGRKPKKT